MYGCSPVQFQNRKHQKITGYGWNHQQGFKNSDYSNHKKNMHQNEVVTFSDSTIKLNVLKKIPIANLASIQPESDVKKRQVEIEKFCTSPLKSSEKQLVSLTKPNYKVLIQSIKKLRLKAEEPEEDDLKPIPKVSWWAFAIAMLLLVVAVGLLFTEIALGYYFIYIILLSVVSFILGYKGLTKKYERNWPSWVAIGVSAAGVIFGALIVALVLAIYIVIGTILAIFTGEWPSLSELGIF